MLHDDVAERAPPDIVGRVDGVLDADDGVDAAAIHHHHAVVAAAGVEVGARYEASAVVDLDGGGAGVEMLAVVLEELDEEHAEVGVVRVRGAAARVVLQEGDDQEDQQVRGEAAGENLKQLEVH